MKRLFILYSTILTGMIFEIAVIYAQQYQLEKFDSQPDTVSELSQPANIFPLEGVWDLIDQVNQDRILTDLRRLTGVEPICTHNGCYTITGRETGSEGLQWAKDYVYEMLLNLNYSIEVLDWSFEGYSDQNIIARKQGLVYPGEEIYFIAHLDGYLDNNPAADDDASGVVSLLELARILSGRKLNRTIVLFFSTGEEHGSLGSRSYVSDYPERLDAIKYLISVEMLGYDSNDDGAMELWTGTEDVEFVNLLAEIIATYQIGLNPEIFSDCY